MSDKHEITPHGGHIKWMKNGTLYVDRPFFGAEEILLQQRSELERQNADLRQQLAASADKTAAVDQKGWSRDDFIERIVLGVAEIPDRDSPEDQPEMMLVTTEELRTIIENAFVSADEDGGIAQETAATVQPIGEVVMYPNYSTVVHWLPVMPPAGTKLYAAPQPQAASEDSRDAARLRNALWLLMQVNIHRYLMSNAHGRLDGAEKATRHIELCQTYLAVVHGVDSDRVRFDHEDEFQSVHTKTQELTDYLDETIGFPLNRRPDYDRLAPLFFDRFIALADAALAQAGKEPK